MIDKLSKEDNFATKNQKIKLNEIKMNKRKTSLSILKVFCTIDFQGKL